MPPKGHHRHKNSVYYNVHRIQFSKNIAGRALNVRLREIRFASIHSPALTSRMCSVALV